MASTISPAARTYADVNAVVGGYPARSGVRAVVAAEDVRIQARRGGDPRARRAADRSRSAPTARLPRIAGIGPGSTRVIREILETGGSPTVEHAIDQSDRRADIERRRQLRRHFLSRAEVRRVLSDPAFAGPTLQQYRGDLQMHSEWSDGYPTVQEIADACLERGYQYAAVTDHSYGLKIAGGMSMAEAAEQRTAIDDVNAAYGSDSGCCRESKRTSTPLGSWISPTKRRQPSMWSWPRRIPGCERSEDQTDRMLAAIAHPAVRILAHPRGRITGSRGRRRSLIGTRCLRPRRSGASRSKSTAIPRDRISITRWRRARSSAGCLFALDSDAHTTAQLSYAETAIGACAARRDSRRQDRQLLAARAAARLVVRSRISDASMSGIQRHTRIGQATLAGPRHTSRADILQALWPT